MTLYRPVPQLDKLVSSRASRRLSHGTILWDETGITSLDTTRKVNFWRLNGYPLFDYNAYQTVTI